MGSGVLEVLVVEELVVQVEVALGQHLEEGLAVEVDLVVVFEGLVVYVRIGEAEFMGTYPLEMMSPFASLSRLVLTPWILMMSPHLMVSCYYDIRYLLINKL
jgi:hypothetical protein